MTKSLPDNNIQLDEILAFLYGEAPLDGVWFGDNSTDRPAFWWRPLLRKSLASYVAERETKARIDELENLRSDKHSDWTKEVLDQCIAELNKELGEDKK